VSINDGFPCANPWLTMTPVCAHGRKSGNEYWVGVYYKPGTVLVSSKAHAYPY
jgi:hypothetical protein